MPERNFSDEDLKKLAEVLKSQFYNNLGKGVWSLAWKAIILALVALAIYGATGHWPGE